MGAHRNDESSMSDCGRAVCLAVAAGLLIGGWAIVVMLLVYLIVRP